MKKARLFFQLVGIGIFAISLIIVGCTKEGPMGPAGADGTDGVDGQDGQDGTTSCLACHNTTVETTITAQYELSTHEGSQNFYPESPLVSEYAGARNDCAKCHSHEGFLETQKTGRDTTAADFAIPTNITCNTCHDSHASFDFETDGQDYALRTSIPVALLMDKNSSLDFGNSSNLCVNCHQPRSAAPVDDGTGNFTHGSIRFGPHHSPQATMVYGIGGYETLTGDYSGARNTTHNTAGSCILCHMNEKDDVASHDWIPTVESCQECHSSLTNFDLNGVQTNVMAKMETLKTLLVANGLIEEGGNTIPGTFSIEHAGALFNYKTVLEDQSHGVHNPAYTMALLDESIAAFD
ncbi:MAG: hypothetical protein N4A59_04225 [Marinifilum sp.]|jgi:hypothetical protein|nr:hypothetical protein [Marinifilum sp.]